MITDELAHRIRVQAHTTYCICKGELNCGVASAGVSGGVSQDISHLDGEQLGAPEVPAGVIARRVNKRAAREVIAAAHRD